MKGKESRKRKISVPIIITILLYITVITSQNVIAGDYIDATFTPQPNNPPIILNTEIPGNTSTNIDTQPTCSIDIVDLDGHLMTIYWYENSTGDWVLRKTTTSAPDGNYQWTYAQATSYSTKYWWKVVVNDSIDNTTAIFHFTTEPEPPAPPQPPEPEPNKEPIANITGPTEGYVNQTIVFYAYNSYDPDGYIAAYRWDFNNDGLFDTDWDKKYVIGFYNYSTPGNYTVKLQVKDNNGATAIDTHNITILPLEPDKKLPVAEANGPYTALVNENITFNSTGSYDPDGTIVNYTWNFGDNHTSYLENPIHRYNQTGAYLVALTVRDNDNLTNTDIATVYISEPDQPDQPDQIVFPFPLVLLLLLAVIITVFVVMIYIDNTRLLKEKEKKRLTKTVVVFKNQKEKISKLRKPVKKKPSTYKRKVSKNRKK